MPTTSLYYDDNCDRIIEDSQTTHHPSQCYWLSPTPRHDKMNDHHDNQARSTSSSTLLRTLLSTNVPAVSKQSAGEARQLALSEFERLRRTHSFHASMMRPTRSVETKSHVQMSSIMGKYKAASTECWHWQTSGDEHCVLDGALVALHPFCDRAACFETHACRGSQPLKRNALTYWEVRVLASRASTSLMVGIGSSRARLSTLGYVNLLGADEHSWALALNTGHIWHKGYVQQTIDDSLLTADGPNTSADDDDKSIRIGCLFDGYAGRLLFYVNGQRASSRPVHVGNGASYFPLVSSTSADSQFRIERVYESMPSLKELCGRQVAKRQLDTSDEEMLPNSIKKFLQSY